MAGLAQVGEYDAGCGEAVACGDAPAVGGGFRNNRMLNGFKVGRNTVAVDAEIGGSGLGNVNVHVKGAGKTMLTSIDDMANLPRRIRENPTVSKAIAKGFEWLSKVGK